VRDSATSSRVEQGAAESVAPMNWERRRGMDMRCKPSSAISLNKNRHTWLAGYVS
jgi:hypothetical protein